MPDSMVFYSSFSSAIKRLPPDEQLKALWSLLDYGLEGKEPEEDGLFMMIFDMAKPQIDANIKRKTNGSGGGRPVKTNGYENKKPMVSEMKTNGSANEKPNVNVNVNENDNVNVKKENKEKKAHFVPPTLENVSEYCRENGYNVDAQRFIDFYESKGWMVGKNKMKDWRAAVRNWSRQSRKEVTLNEPEPTNSARLW
jgi:hypothetical protein